MATSTLPFEIQIAQDLADLIEKVSQELRKQDDLFDPKVVSLFRIYLSAIRQYQSLSKHLTMAEKPKPAPKAKPAAKPVATPKAKVEPKVEVATPAPKPKR